MDDFPIGVLGRNPRVPYSMRISNGSNDSEHVLETRQTTRPPRRANLWIGDSGDFRRTWFVHYVAFRR